ncbi:MAG: hypothetical protein IKA61_07650, partial [Clostridia bacterium]|nr:hypothetical protein [Clostridia bacterium]
MGKIFKKVVCLLLGAILGISSILATVVTAGYYMYSELPVGNIVAPGKEEDLGEIGDFSVEDILDLLQQGSTAPENYTIADLKEKYGLDVIGLINSLGGDKPLIDENDEQFIADLESVSIFTLFSDEGITRFLSDLPVGAVLGFISEDTFLSKAEREKLRSYSVGQLIAKDEVTGQLGLMTALSEIKVGGVLTSLFVDTGNGVYRAKDGAPEFLNLIANIEFGAFINVMLGETTVGDELVEGGLSSVGDLTVGELLNSVLGEGNSLATTLDNLLNNVQLKDLFEKDLASGSYKFVIDKLLDNIKLGALLGYEKDEDGNWFKEDENGNLVPVGGLMEAIASLDFTTLYHIFTSDAPVKEKLHSALSVLGDVTIGGIFELLGYTVEEDQWYDKNGKPVSDFLEVIFSISVEDIIGESASDLSLKNIRINLVEIIAASCGDLTLGEGLGGLFGVELNADGKYVHTKGAKEGQTVNAFLQNLLDVKMADLVDSLGGDKIDINNLLTVLEGALAGATVGDLVGAEKENGKWYKDDAEVGGVGAILYEMNFAGIFAALKQLGSDGFSYAAVIEGLFPELTMGQIVSLFKKDLTGEDMGTYVQYSTAKGEVENGLNVILNLKLWQVVAGFDANHPFNLKEVIQDIPLGEVLNLVKQEDGSWKISDTRTAYGAIAEIFDLTLGELLSDEEGTTKELIKMILKRVELGDVFTLALGYDPEARTFPFTEEGKRANEILIAFCEWDFTIGDVIAIVKGEMKVDAEFIRNELKNLLGHVAFGETFRNVLTDFVSDESNVLTMKTLTELKGILDPIFNTPYSFYIDLIFDALAGQDLDVVEVLREIYGETTLGDLFAPILKVTKDANGIYVFEDGKSLGKGITDLLDSVLVEIVEVLVKGEGSIIDKLDVLFNENVININNRLGDYLTVFGITYENGKWVKKDGSEITYEPIVNVLNMNLLEALNTLLLDETKTGEDKRNYVIDIFEDVTLGDLLSFVPAISESDKLLLQKLCAVEIDTLLLDILDSEKKLLDVIKTHLGSIQLGDIANLIMGATPNGDVWFNANGEELPYILSDIFSVSVADILDIIGADDKVVAAVETIFGERTFGDYLGNFGLTKVTESKFLKKLCEEQVAEFVKGLLDAENKLSFVLDYFDEGRIGDLVGTFIDLTEANGVWSLNGNDFPYILGDILSVSVGEIKEIIKSDNKIVTAVEVIFDQRTFGDYLDNLGITKITENNFFDKFCAEKVAVFVKGLLDAENKIEFVLSYFEFGRIGDLVGLFIDLTEENGVWSLNGKELPYILGDILSVSVGEIMDIIKSDSKVVTVVETIFDQRTFGDYLSNLGLTKITENNFFKELCEEQVAEFVKGLLDAENKAEYLLGYFDEGRIGDALGLILGATEENGVWYDKNGEEFPALIQSILGISVGEILDVVKKNTTAKDFVKDKFGDIKLSDIPDAIPGLDVGEGVTQMGLPTVTINGNPLPAIVGDILKITVNDILGLIEDHSKENISAFVHKLTDDKTLLQYVADLLGKEEASLGNKGVDMLLDICIAELVDVLTGLKTDVTNPMIDNPKIAYILNITDEILLGYFLSNYEYIDGKWYQNGVLVEGIMETVLNIPLSYFLYLIGAIMDPSMVVEMIQDVRIGDVIQTPYNNISALDSTIIGDKEDKETPYAVEGAFKFFMEDLANLTFGDMHESALVRKTAVQDLKRFMLDRPLGDYLFDLFSQIILKNGKGAAVGLVGFGSDSFVTGYARNAEGRYVVTANLAEVIGVVLNFNVAKLLEAENKGDYLKGEISHILIGDLLYDGMRKLLEDKIHFGFAGKFAWEDKKVVEGKEQFVLRMNLRDVIQPLFNINIVELLNADNKL